MGVLFVFVWLCGNDLLLQIVRQWVLDCVRRARVLLDALRLKHRPKEEPNQIYLNLRLAYRTLVAPPSVILWASATCIV